MIHRIIEKQEQTFVNVKQIYNKRHELLFLFPIHAKPSIFQGQCDEFS